MYNVLHMCLLACYRSLIILFHFTVRECKVSAGVRQEIIGRWLKCRSILVFFFNKGRGQHRDACFTSIYSICSETFEQTLNYRAKLYILASFSNICRQLVDMFIKHRIYITNLIF
jgi:hypothetical protein